ncbi:MAG TPA: NADP-dependent oxidoreductase [Phenylobacterium sp.]|nr:NADP-dependent oxidoreductase [Phenylobacterium sp.]
MERLENRRWVLARRPRGRIKAEDFRRDDTSVPEPSDGEFVVRVTHLSFDPTQRGWITSDTYLPAVPVGGVVRAAAVGQVVRSRHPGFPVGRMVQGGFGWQDYALTDGQTDLMAVTETPPGSTPEEALGVFGITGMTAYFGLSEIGIPQPGETVLVSAAAGATGSVAVQLAKAAGCKVIGIAGGPEKCAWVAEVAGADACIDYKSQNVWRELARLAPEGLDVVFENVGGEILEAAIMNLAHGGRIIMCGAISVYEADPREQKGVRFLLNLAMKRASIKGFIVLDFEARYPEAIAALQAHIAAGALRSAVDMQEGFENIPATLNRLFDGRNTGKQLLKIADPPLVAA